MDADAVVLVLFRAAVPGQVKTRLAAALGAEAALAAYKAILADLDRHLRDLHCSVETLVDRHAPPQRVYWPDSPVQHAGDLGERMAAALEGAFSRGFRRAVLIGSDTPQMGAESIRGALRHLEAGDMVIGPASDGGYYLVGFRASGYRRELFQNMPWSTDRVFLETMDRARRAGLEVGFCDELTDIDTIDDLRSVVQNPVVAKNAPTLTRWWRAQGDAHDGDR